MLKTKHWFSYLPNMCVLGQVSQVQPHFLPWGRENTLYFIFPTSQKVYGITPV